MVDLLQQMWAGPRRPHDVDSTSTFVCERWAEGFSNNVLEAGCKLIPRLCGLGTMTDGSATGAVSRFESFDEGSFDQPFAASIEVVERRHRHTGIVGDLLHPDRCFTSAIECINRETQNPLFRRGLVLVVDDRHELRVYVPISGVLAGSYIARNIRMV